LLPDLTAAQEVLAMQLHHGRSFFRSGEMKQFFGKSRDLLLDCRAAGWIQPTVDGNRRKMFHISDIVACLRRIHSEGPPPPAPKPPEAENKLKPAAKSTRRKGNERS
jgi:hypothetical protein